MFYNDRVDISFEKWCAQLADSSITKEADVKVLQFIYQSPNHEARASEIAEYLGMLHHGPLNLQISRFSKRILQKTGVEPPIRSDGSIRWWHIPFLGYEKAGRFPWIMRPELVMAFEEVYGIAESEREITYPDDILVENYSLVLTEGLMRNVLINRYERNRKARNNCLQHYGYKCIICSFDFEKTYGPIGKNIIHIHHITPISKIGHDYIVDPIHDLQPVCPNCHAIIHSKRDPFSTEEVIAILMGQRNDA